MSERMTFLSGSKKSKLRKLLSLFALISTSFLVACASMHERASKYMERGAYEEAIETYEDILISDQSDKVAKAGLREARRKWLSQKLIEVRLLRLAGNRIESLELLTRVYEKENRWSVFPAGAAISTQEEETHYARGNIKHLVESSLQKNHPLKARSLLVNYSFLFQHENIKKSYHQLFAKVQRQGRKKCRGYVPSIQSNQLFYGMYVKNYCALWDDKSVDLAKQIRNGKKYLYSKVSVQSKSKNLPVGFKQNLETQFNKVLKSSPWYLKSAKVLNLNLAADYTYNYESFNQKLEHSYTVEVPFEVRERRVIHESDKAKDPNALEAVVGVLELISAISDLSDGKPHSSYSYDNGDGTETVVSTRYRDEVRTQPYDATLHLQSYLMKLAILGAFNNGKIEFAQTFEDEKSFIEHHNNMPHIGLSPQPKRLFNERDWVKEKVSYIANEFNYKLNVFWDDQNCFDPKLLGNVNSHTIENMFRCLKMDKQSVPFSYNDWFMKNTGLTLSEAEEALGGTIL